MNSSANDSVAKAVRRTLIASAALAPTWFWSPQAAAQSVDAGPDRVVADPEGDGENVTLQGSASSSTGGSLTLVWSNSAGVTIATGSSTPTVRLSAGVHQLTLTATESGNSSGSSDVVFITVAAGRTPNNNAVGQHLRGICSVIAAGEGGSLGSEAFLAPAAVQSASVGADLNDLRDRCGVISGQLSSEDETAAFNAMGAQDFNSIRTQAVIFSQTQYQSIMDRLQSLRAGTRGISLAGLTINSGGNFVSGEQIADTLQHALGGGAAAEPAEGGLLGDALGFWGRGNFGSGDKETTIADSGFDADQAGITLGMDYRFNNSVVAGVALGYGDTDLEFNAGRGGFDQTSLSGSLYASAYVGDLYLDGVVNYIASEYDTVRNIEYDEFGTTIRRTALGTTDGSSLSGGVAVGYDFTFGALTVAPTVGYYYVNSKVDEFVESGASGLDLRFLEQDYESSTANAGLRLSYAIKTSWGVIMPHFRGQLVREFEDDVEVFNVRFANDPLLPATASLPPIAVQSDEVDDSYVRLAAGFSVQLPGKLSGYAEYQRLEAFDHVSFSDYTVGLRLQHSFR